MVGEKRVEKRGLMSTDTSKICKEIELWKNHRQAGLVIFAK